MELFGNWTLDDARARTVPASIRQFYHRGRDACQRTAVGEADLARMKALDIGLSYRSPAGLFPADLPLFKDINVKAFIAGRALAGVAHPHGLPPTRKSTLSGRTVCTTVRYL